MVIAGFILAHFCLLLILLGLVFPRYYNVFIPPGRRTEGKEETIANQPKEQELLPEIGVLDCETGVQELVSDRKSSDGIDTGHSKGPRL